MKKTQFQFNRINHEVDRGKYIFLCPMLILWSLFIQATLVSLTSPVICKAFTKFKG